MDVPRVEDHGVAREGHRVGVPRLERQRALDDVLQTDKRELDEPGDLVGMAHIGDEVRDGVVDAAGWADVGRWSGLGARVAQTG